MFNQYIMISCSTVKLENYVNKYVLNIMSFTDWLYATSKSLFILILIITHDIKLFSKCENVFFLQAMRRFGMIYFGNFPKIGIRILE